jgi:small-conductance mechanosensitive channel
VNELFKIYATGAGFVAGGLVLGILLEKILLRFFIKEAAKTFSKADDVILNSLKGLLIFWGVLGGIYLGLKYLPLEDEQYKIWHRIFLVALAVSFAILISRIIIGLIKLRISKTPGLIPSTTIISTITRVIVFLVATLVVLQTLGISVTPILTALGIGGVAVALALQETLTNFFSGVQVIASQQIRPGDYIKLNTGEEGYITDITWRSTSIRMLSGSLIVVPNSKISSANLTNYYRPDKELAVLIEMGVSYDSDLNKVENVTVETAKEILKKTAGGVENFEPFIRYHSFKDSSIGFTVILRAKEFTDQYLIKHEFVKALHKAYKENAIEIPFPIRSIKLQQPFLEDHG